MDDPWGSPWAEEASSPGSVANIKVVSVPSISVEKEDSGGSNWGLDDGFGDWEINVSGNASSATKSAGRSESEDNESALNPNDTSTPPTYTSAWPQYPLEAANAFADTPQQASDGGIDAELHWQVEDSKEDELRPGDLSTKGSEILDRQPGLDLDLVDGKDSTDQLVEATLPTDELQGDDHAVEENTYEVTLDSHSSKDTTPNPRIEEPVQGLESPASRPSTPPSEHSHQDAVAVESPRTSFEDTPKRPQLLEGESPKVLEPVESSDNIAEDEAKGTSKPENPETSSLEGSELDTLEKASDDFGDFEEGPSEGPHESDFADLREDQSFVPDDSNLVRAVVADQSHVGGQAQSVAEAELSYGTDFGDLDITPNLSLIDDMFSDDPALCPEDTVATKDSDLVDVQEFSSIDQRKIWYRISRYGTLRKYNTGNDENYVRINWANSTVRAETLKIVARWMESYGIHGGNILGGEKRLGSLFGWRDSNSEPSIVSAEAASEILRSRSRNHQKEGSTSSIAMLSPSSVTSKDMKDRTATMRPVDQKIKPKSPLAAPPAFNWSTSQPHPPVRHSRPEKLKVPPIIPQPPPSRPMPSPGLPMPSPLSLEPLQPLKISQRHEISTGATIPPFTFPTRTTPSLTALTPRRPVPAPLRTDFTSDITADTDDDDDDDEWGEMVSSPAIPVLLPQIPMPRLGHKASQSLMNIPTINMSKQQFSSRSKHGPSMSMSESISTPGLVDRIIGSPQIKSRSRTSTVTSSPARRSHKPSVSISDGLASPGLIDSIMGSPQITSRSVRSTTASPILDLPDAWASADLSSFDIPVLQPQLGSPRLPATPKNFSPLQQHFNADTLAPPKGSPVLEVRLNRLPYLPPPLPPPRTNATLKKASEGKEGEQEKMVKDIIRALPDLSYMLR